MQLRAPPTARLNSGEVNDKSRNYQNIPQAQHFFPLLVNSPKLLNSPKTWLDQFFEKICIFLWLGTEIISLTRAVSEEYY